MHLRTEIRNYLVSEIDDELKEYEWIVGPFCPEVLQEFEKPRCYVATLSESSSEVTVTDRVQKRTLQVEITFIRKDSGQKSLDLIDEAMKYVEYRLFKPENRFLNGLSSGFTLKDSETGFETTGEETLCYGIIRLEVDYKTEPLVSDVRAFAGVTSNFEVQSC